MDAVLHALADESRRTVLGILRDHPASAGELAESLPIARPGVSRHLRVLREAGLIEYIVERDDAGTPPRSPADALTTARVGYNYLANLRF